MTQPTALVLLFDGVEELEAIAPIDCLRRAGVLVTTASTGQTRELTGRNGIRLVADCLLTECRGTSHDLLVLPGGPGHTDLVRREDILELLRQQAIAGRWLASICAGPVVLQAAGLLEGKRFTSFPGTVDQLPERDMDSPVVRDGHLITSQGAGTAIEFALALVGALCGSAKRDEIAASICHRDQLAG